MGFFFEVNSEAFFINFLRLKEIKALKRDYINIMSSRYDSRTTTFSPEGRLFQVEYAVEAIQQAGTVIGIQTKEGVVLIAEKALQHPLFDVEGEQLKNIAGEKAFRLADHLGCCVAGITSDANELLEYARLVAHRHEYTFQEPMAVEDLCRAICDEKQLFTQYGSVRPYGVSFMIAGWDRYFGFQLFATEPSGDYNAWSAYAIGKNDVLAQTYLRKDWKDDMSLEEAQVLGLRVLSKIMDAIKLPKERVEMAVLKKVDSPRFSRMLDPYAPNNGAQTSFSLLTQEAMKPLMAEAERQQQAEEQAEADKERERDQKLDG